MEALLDFREVRLLGCLSAVKDSGIEAGGST